MIRAAKVMVLVVFVSALLSIALQVVVVPTASMEGTVLVGDHLLIDRFAYGPNVPFTHIRFPRLKTVKRGDVVSFHPPGRPGEVYLKRVVAAGGDRVQSRDGDLYVNGQRRVETYVQCGICRANSQEILVPQNELYLLGDNREHSEDSRSFGTVPVDNIIGEPVVVLWSFANPTKQWLRSQVSVYFDHPVAHLRWERFFQTVE